MVLELLPMGCYLSFVIEREGSGKTGFDHP